MKVYIASDHAGFALKEALIAYLPGISLPGGVAPELEDMGAYSFSPDDDYPDVVTPCAQQVALDDGSVGIVIGASGQGEAMVANRVLGIRAAVYYGSPRTMQSDVAGHELDMISSVRVHNDANILALGARFITEDDAKEAVRVFLSTAFTRESRHLRRIGKF